ncbi:NAD(P)-dependent oxidoreductase [Acinetobacter sp. ANC 4173]|uniref:NAD(P)-dependent oxidoreductase n=1 Tax=Acinetobacter sp. ANC 4173 TaxID=2529837 RepID=UPI001D0D895A
MSLFLILINLINNTCDLLAALDSGHLDGTILDVFEHEPLSSENPLWHHRILL